MDGLERVPVIGGADDDGIEVFLLEQLAVVVVLPGTAADLVGGEIEIRLGQIADGDDRSILVLEEALQNLIAAITQADKAEPDAVIGAGDARAAQRCRYTG